MKWISGDWGGTLLPLLLFLILVERCTSVKWLALHRVKHKPWQLGKNCSKKLGLVKQQVKICRDNLDLMPSIARAASFSVETCQSQFSDRRWNCSSIGELPARSKDLVRGTREKAYVYGIASAALVHTVARSCSIGITTKCSCGVLPNSAPSGTFKWGGCGDDVHFGMYFGQQFTESTLISKQGKVKKSTKAMMDEHNFAAGRAVVRDSLSTACKCHGVSGSCSIKTCWKALPDFDSIGATLKQRYALAVEVKRRKRKKERVLVPIAPGQATFAEDELIYYVKSPDYCSPDEQTGSVGTRGRLCDPATSGPGNCNTMCCGRGADNFTMEVQERCECKYYWCCYVKCKTCSKILNLSQCK